MFHHPSLLQHPNQLSFLHLQFHLSYLFVSQMWYYLAEKQLLQFFLNYCQHQSWHFGLVFHPIQIHLLKVSLIHSLNLGCCWSPMVAFFASEAHLPVSRLNRQTYFLLLNKWFEFKLRFLYIISQYISQKSTYNLNRCSVLLIKLLRVIHLKCLLQYLLFVLFVKNPSVQSIPFKLHVMCVWIRLLLPRSFDIKSLRWCSHIDLKFTLGANSLGFVRRDIECELKCFRTINSLLSMH